jgi:hypothetical protein
MPQAWKRVRRTSHLNQKLSQPARQASNKCGIVLPLLAHHVAIEEFDVLFLRIKMNVLLAQSPAQNAS